MTRRVPRPSNSPRYLHPREFEDEATLLLAEYASEHGAVATPPIPIDDIIEEHLKIAIEIRDLRAEYPEGNVLGAIYFKEKLIIVDQSLVPEEFPSMRGRYRFTLAHELGHWRLHRHLYLRRAGEQSLFAETPTRPSHVLRSGDSDPKEVQANRFAACLLMPREMVKRCWHELHGSMEPIYLDDLRARVQLSMPLSLLRRGGEMMGDAAEGNALFEQAARPLAEKFEVSADAMRIRLEEMKLLIRNRDRTLF